MTSDSIRELAHFLRDVVRPAIHPDRVALEVGAHHVHGEPVPPSTAVTAMEFGPFAVGERWGAMWDTTWFRFRATIPGTWSGDAVAALIHLGGEELVGFSAEGLVLDPSGSVIQGLHHKQREVLVCEDARGGQVVELYVEAAANPIPKWDGSDWPMLEPDYGGAPLYVLSQAELVTVECEVESLYHDMRIALQIAKHLPDRRDEAVSAMETARAVFERATNTAGFVDARAALAPVLGRNGNFGRHAVAAVGHAHIDSAWLWPARESKRKCARSFANQLRLLERYPEHRFAASQAAQYQWMKDLYPQLFERIRRRVLDGSWEPVGGMWVEPDCNIPCGESLVRQFVHGKRFFADEFGVETHEMWIPDVFGYSAALPQIARQAGVTALVTQKMCWNDTNVFPHSTFWWEGHDGSTVLAHFPPANTYNGEFSVLELATSQQNFKDHDRSDRSLYPFGYGDGGGGPSPAMLESARRLLDIEGLPQVEIGTVGGFLEGVRSGAPSLATWVGELYLEFHRGTYTTHADVKFANRRGEEALRAAEMWSVAAALDRRDDLDAAWKLLLFNQFHDILPGSSIHWVYDDAARDHVSVLAAAESVIDEAQTVLAGGDWVAFNSSSYDRDEVVELPDGALAAVSVPGCGWASVASDSTVSAGDVRVGDDFMENEHLLVAWESDGLLSSVWDKAAQREVLAAGQRGNLFQLHEDHPSSFDAWEVERGYLDEVEDLVSVDSIEVTEAKSLRCCARFVRSFGPSTITQNIRLRAGSRLLEFDTVVDWRHRHRFLKVAFPVAIRSARATFEIQHGHVERPTVANTTWDEARFEVCAHRWADLSEPGYGVALINDCKYGYDIRGNVIRLSLLRGPGYPDPVADLGTHRFRYALLPHPGDLRADGHVVEEAEHFNLPLLLRPGGAGPGGATASGRLISVDRSGVSVEAVKWADRVSGVVVRLCEVWGSRRPARVTLSGVDFSDVYRTDLLERDIEPVAHDGPTVELQLRPFELVTLRFAP